VLAAMVDTLAGARCPEADRVSCARSRDHLAPGMAPQFVRFVRISLLNWDPVTESNRRPSPYHVGLAGLPAWGFGERPGQTLHFSSVGSCSGRFAKDATSQIPPNRPWRSSSV
jgi:hypothetical protein